MAEILTATEQRIFNLLSDGRPHTKEEIHTCINDELAPVSAIANHISRMRKQLRVHGKDVICSYRGGVTKYQLVRLMHSPNDGVMG